MKHQTDACRCCEGIEKLTPLPTANRPGLTQLIYRVGTHATFFETMLARLSNLCLGSGEECKARKGLYPLQALKTREGSDPAIALLDAWATVADVLTFYQERIVNEGYLRTATERRSVLELARLVGYELRPGVSSSVFLAYTLDENLKDEVVIPEGARAQSVPGPGELPQSFETSEDLKARAKWNNLKPRMTQPQTPDTIDLDRENTPDKKSYKPRVYLKGIGTNLKPNDPLLIDFPGTGHPIFYRVQEVKPDPAADLTLVTLQAKVSLTPPPPVREPIDLVGALTLPPSVQRRNSLRLQRNLDSLFSRSGTKQTPGPSFASTAITGLPSDSLRKTLAGGEASHAVLKAFAPVLSETLATAAANADVTPESQIRVYALRLKASLFGHNHPGTPLYKKAVLDDVPMIQIEKFVPPKPSDMWPEEMKTSDKEAWQQIGLDPQNDQIEPESWVVIERPILILEHPTLIAGTPIETTCRFHGWTYSIHQVQEVKQTTMSALGISSKVSLLTVKEPWLRDLKPDEKFDDLNKCTSLLRQTSAYAQSEELELSEEPIDRSICGDEGEIIELDGFYEGLESGRWVIVSGEREITGTGGVRFSELAMLSTVTQDIQVRQNSSSTADTTTLAGNRLHSFIKLANKLEYCFKRETVTIYGNVVQATHGETRKEVLGSGDGTRALQSFSLKQPPLTFISAANPSGVDSTLKVYVNDVQWHEADSLAALSPTDRKFITKTNDEGNTTVVFGNGREGARLPTGMENIKAEYRNGIGKPGNAKAGQITLLATRPLGVKEVINPLRASGGADKESRDQARRNAPLAVKALDRLVSVQDYQDFARTYAGIGKACARELSDGRRQLVHVTIAGADDIPIDETSDLFGNLRQSLLDFGDPFQPILLAVRELRLIVISANVRMMPDYQWEPVITHVREALLDAFSFERRELGQDVLLSEVVSIMQAVPGVAYVDVDTFGGIPEKNVKEVEEVIDGNKVKVKKRLILTPEEIAGEVEDLVKTSQEKRGPRSRLKVNLADYEEGIIRPAQLAFLTPDVPATLILNQII